MGQYILEYLMMVEIGTLLEAYIGVLGDNIFDRDR